MDSREGAPYTGKTLAGCGLSTQRLKHWLIQQIHAQQIHAPTHRV